MADHNVKTRTADIRYRLSAFRIDKHVFVKLEAIIKDQTARGLSVSSCMQGFDDQFRFKKLILTLQLCV